MSSKNALLSGWLNRWRQSSLIRSVGALTAGTIAAQGIQLLNLVVLAKCYPLADVGLYSVFLAMVGTLTPAAMLGYEMLIPTIEESELDAYIKALFLMAIPIAVLMGAGAVIGGYGHAYLLAPWIAGAAIQRLAEMHNVRKSRFSLASAARIMPPLLMTVLLAVFISSGHRDINALIVWQSGLTLVVGLGYALTTLPRGGLAAPATAAELRSTLIKNINAPRYLMPSNILNLIAYNIPVVIVSRWFGAEIAAQYSYVLRFGFGPVGLVGGTLYQVFYSLLAKAVRTGNSALFRQFMRARYHIGWAALTAAIAIAVVYPIGFRLLGPQWAAAGWISVIFAPFFGAMLYLTPLSVSLNTFGRQDFELKTQLHYCVISIFSFGTALLVGNAWIGFMLFSWLGCLRYALLLRDINGLLQENGVIRHADDRAAD